MKIYYLYILHSKTCIILFFLKQCIHTLTERTVQWQWQPFCACVFPLSLSAERIRRELGWEPGQHFGRSRCTGQCMTNESVMHTVEPGQRPAQLIRLVNTAQVNLTTKTPPHLHCCIVLPPPASGKRNRDLSWFDFKEGRGLVNEWGDREICEEGRKKEARGCQASWQRRRAIAETHKQTVNQEVTCTRRWW